MHWETEALLVRAASDRPRVDETPESIRWPRARGFRLRPPAVLPCSLVPASPRHTAPELPSSSCSRQREPQAPSLRVRVAEIAAAEGDPGRGGMTARLRARLRTTRRWNAACSMRGSHIRSRRWSWTHEQAEPASSHKWPSALPFSWWPPGSRGRWPRSFSARLSPESSAQGCGATSNTE